MLNNSLIHSVEYIDKAQTDCLAQHCRGFHCCVCQNLAPFKLLILNNVTFFYWPVNYFRSINIVGSFYLLHFYSILIQS